MAGKDLERRSVPAALDTRDPQALALTVGQAFDYLENRHLELLEQYPLAPLSKELATLRPSQLAQMFRVTDIIYAKEEDFLQKAVTLLYTAYALRATVLVILRSRGAASGGKCEYYMGLACPNDRDNLSETVESYEEAFCGNFPGSRVSRLKNDELETLMKEVYGGEQAVTSVSGIPALRGSDKHSIANFIQGIENMVASLRGCSYTLVLQADPVSPEEIRTIRQGYEACYTNLSPFAKTEYNSSLSHSSGIQTTRSDSHSEGTQETDSNSTSKGTSKQHTTSEGTSKSIGGSLNAGALLGAALTAVGTIATVVPTGIGQAVGPALMAGGAALSASGLSVSTSKGKFNSEGDCVGENQSITNQHSSGKSEQDTTSYSEGESQQDSRGMSVQFSREDKRVQDLMKLLEKNLERLQECESFGTFAGCAYVISNSGSVNRRVAALYSALMRGDSSFAQSAQLHTWMPDANGCAEIKASLSHFCHPRFLYSLGDQSIAVTPALLTSGQELALQIGLPKRALPGISVREVVQFGCNPPQQDRENAEKQQAIPWLKLGCVQHLTRDLAEIPVMLSSDDLTAHTFITGSTGAGKSNAVYTILKELCALGEGKADVPRFLIVEPAKGEYKDALGGYPGVNVYGTNPYKTPLLRLNPFSFSEDTHILEHIDRLIEIFNACWPMYAAMPAVLKAAVEQAYIGCGWSLNASVCTSGKRVFPTFRDVMQALAAVVDSKGFSVDTQGDYKGALLTRLESLTNGINGQVFCSYDEMSDTALFDENAIVDLSRVGSSETKALLMGVLILKLQEHRMAQRASGENTANSGLRHITVLEEAHNLLRRTSTEQSQDSSNLQGKAVEMLTNAIAEMRTYGEGFIIADQAPGLLDMAAIRNTNTKLILRLPEESDRVLVGKAAGLSDEQITELAKLDVGVAAVFQNHWLEPVLCKVDRFDREVSYRRKGEKAESQFDNQWFDRELLKFLLNKRFPASAEQGLDIGRLERELPIAPLSSKHKLELTRLIQEYKETKTLELWEQKRFGRLSRLTVELLDCGAETKRLILNANTFEQLDQQLTELIEIHTGAISTHLRLAVCQCILKDFDMVHPEKRAIYQNWREFALKEVSG